MNSGCKHISTSQDELGPVVSRSSSHIRPFDRSPIQPQATGSAILERLLQAESSAILRDSDVESPTGSTSRLNPSSRQLYEDDERHRCASAASTADGWTSSSSFTPFFQRFHQVEGFEGSEGGYSSTHRSGQEQPRLPSSRDVCSKFRLSRRTPDFSRTDRDPEDEFNEGRSQSAVDDLITGKFEKMMFSMLTSNRKEHGAVQESCRSATVPLSGGYRSATVPLSDGYRPMEVHKKLTDTTKHTTIRQARYVGSFTVAGADQLSRIQFARHALLNVKERRNSVCGVRLAISFLGIDVCDREDESSGMWHITQRISYATCDPQRCMFAFLAREPRGHHNLQYCHTFFTDTPQQAEELNAIVDNAFRMAYAAQMHTGIGCNSVDGDDRWSSVDSKKNETLKTNNKTWGRQTVARTRHRASLLSRRVASTSVEKNHQVNQLSDAEDDAVRRALRRSMAGFDVTVGDLESRSSESDVRPLSCSHSSSVSASFQSLHEADSKASLWPSESGSIDLNLHSDETASSSPSNSSPLPAPPASFYHRGRIVSEEQQLRNAPWFQPGIPREIALEVLAQESVGAFMVRESTTKHGCFALSLRVPRDYHVSGIAHYLILNTTRGYKIKGFTKDFTSLTALIVHHSVMPELLPITLALSRGAVANLTRTDSLQELSELPSAADLDEYNSSTGPSDDASCDTTNTTV